MDAQQSLMRPYAKSQGPKDGTVVLVGRSDIPLDQWVMAYWRWYDATEQAQGGWMDVNTDRAAFGGHVTHWMPIEDAPTSPDA